jgi:DNA 3'-phosphatase
MDKKCLPKTVDGHLSTTVLLNRPIAAFDFDSTLREHRGKGPDEQMTIRFLSHLSKSFNIVIFSNRKSGGSVAEMEKYVGALPVSYLGSLARDRFRKPHRGMWELYIAHVTELGYEVENPQYAASFFCGDAAGRVGDFAATDLTFAMHCELRFITPEVLFGGITNPLPWKKVESHLRKNPNTGYSRDDIVCLNSPASDSSYIQMINNALHGGETSDENKKWCLILMGGQASGKSSLAQDLCESGYKLISREHVPLKTHLRHMADAFRGKSDIVIDGTHPTIESRRWSIQAAQSAQFGVAIVHLTTPKTVCMHLNSARCEMDKTNRTMEIPSVAIHTYWKKRELPQEGEADMIINLPFILSVQAAEIMSFRYG